MQTGLIKTGLDRTAAAFAKITGTGRRRAAVLATAVATVATVAGLAVPAGASPVVARAVTGTEHFQMMTLNGNATKLPLIAYGVFTAPGTDRENANGTDTFLFAGGSFTVVHIPGKGQPQQPTFNTKTCMFQFNQKGTFKLSGGTGKYKGISGTGTYALSLIGLGPKLKSGACNPSQNAPLVAFQQIVSANGKVTLP